MPIHERYQLEVEKKNLYIQQLQAKRLQEEDSIINRSKKTTGREYEVDD
jgi:hypothetical protein